MITYYTIKFHLLENIGIALLKYNFKGMACWFIGHATAAGVRAGIFVPNPKRREAGQPLLIHYKDL